MCGGGTVKGGGGGKELVITSTSTWKAHELSKDIRSSVSPLWKRVFPAGTSTGQLEMSRKSSSSCSVCVDVSIERLCSCTRSSQSWPWSVVTLEYPSTHALKSSGVAFIGDLVYNACSASPPCVVLFKWL